jgi:hypothetical protein
LGGVTAFAGASEVLGEASLPDLVSDAPDPDEEDSVLDSGVEVELLVSPAGASEPDSFVDSEVLRAALFWSFLPSLP